MVEFCVEDDNKNDTHGFITKILPRKNVLIRPEVANIDTMFITFALASPDPNLISIDKLTALAEHHSIKAVIVFNKSDIADGEKTREMVEIYEKSGYDVVVLSAKNNETEVREKLLPLAKGSVCVFTGPSGVGKSTIINALFPSLALETGKVSEKTRRGKNTTRNTTLYRTGENTYFVDTPGFTLLDFDRFRFMKKEELVFAFPEYKDYLGSCRYTKCSHTKEEGCAILSAINEGKLPTSRHESYLYLFDILKNHKDWEK
jgi:ribosome biogenesis GTPase